MCLVTTIDKYSSFTKLQRVTAWLLRFVFNYRVRKDKAKPEISVLAFREITAAECYWLSISKGAHFPAKLEALKPYLTLAVSCLSILSWLIRVGGRE